MFSVIHITTIPIHNKLILTGIDRIIQVIEQIFSPGIIVHGEIAQVISIKINDSIIKQKPNAKQLNVKRAQINVILDIKQKTIIPKLFSILMQIRII